MKRKNIVIGIIIAVIVVAVIGYSYAYFNAKITNNTVDNTFTAGKMEVTFADGPEIKLDPASPNKNITKTFTVTNTGDFDTSYNLKLANVINTFVDRTDLRYTLKRNSEELKTLSVPKGNNYIATNLEIGEGQTDTYEITIEFKETATNQNDNQGASFSGIIQVDSEENVNLLTNPKVQLYQGMIPVDFDGNGNVVVADTNDLWYDYTVSEWANAVLVNAEDPTIKAKYFDGDNLKTDIANKVIPMEEILQMYVYIPRYKYQLFNVNNGSVPKQIINIQFEEGTETTGTVSCTYTDMQNGTVKEDCINARKGEWYTHPAFTFGSTNLPGIWVGKFEPSDPTDESGRANTIINEIEILPGKTSMINKTISTMFFAERNIELKYAAKYNLKPDEIDTHMMKNIEWGAVAYLTQSIYGIYKDESHCNIEGMVFEECEVWMNNTAQGTGTTGTYSYGGTYTGCTADSVSAGAKWNTDNTDGTQPAECDEGNKWSEKGINASTTGNMYGIYDMSGGTWEYTMGVILEKEGNEPYYNSDHSGFYNDNMPDKKYYDLYGYSESYTSIARGHLGDATRETLSIIENGDGSWNTDRSWFPYIISNNVSPWFGRGGKYIDFAGTGIFAYVRCKGNAEYLSFRSVLSAA